MRTNLISDFITFLKFLAIVGTVIVLGGMLT